MGSDSQAGDGPNRHLTRVQHSHQQSDLSCRDERTAYDATLIRFSAANTITLPMPIGFVEIGDTEWPFSKMCQEGW